MAKGKSFIKSLVRKINIENTDIMSDGNIASEFDTYLDVGSYALNAAASGSMYGGLPDNKISIFPGDSQTGKTYFVLGLIKNFQSKYPGEKGLVVFYDTEGAVTKQMMNQRGVDLENVVYATTQTVEEFRHHAAKTLDSYSKMDADDRPKMIFILDSIGQLSTNKEVGDILAGKDTADMTRARLIKGTFRALNLNLAQNKVPLICTNHQYDSMAMYSPKVQSGGSGPKYSASTVISLTRAKARDSDKNVIGVIITATINKSRFTKEDEKVKLFISRTDGLHKHFGLIDFAVDAGIWTKASKGINIADGTNVSIKKIYAEPETYFTKQVMQGLETYVAKRFLYESYDDEGTPKVVEDIGEERGQGDEGIDESEGTVEGQGVVDNAVH